MGRRGHTHRKTNVYGKAQRPGSTMEEFLLGINLPTSEDRLDQPHFSARGEGRRGRPLGHNSRAEVKAYARRDALLAREELERQKRLKPLFEAEGNSASDIANQKEATHCSLTWSRVPDPYECSTFRDFENDLELGPNGICLGRCPMERR